MSETDTEYFKLLKNLCTRSDENKNSKLQFAYTPVHGVGTRFVKMAMEVFNLKPLIEVELQKNPDPEFPTVKFPNPEEGEGIQNI